MTRLPAPLDGSWERPGRNPLAAGVAGLLLIGALYSTFGGVFLSVIVALMMPGVHAPGTGTLLDFILEYYRAFQVPILAVTMFMEFLLFFGLVLLLARRWHSSRPFAFLSWRRPAVADILLAGAGAILVVPLAELLDRWTYLVIPALRQLAGAEDALLAARSPLQTALVVAAISFTPAVCEETLFRGWLMGSLRRRLGFVPALVTQAVVFALFHLSPLSLVALTFVGMFLGLLYERTGTLFASGTAHATYNATIVVVANAAPSWLVSSSGGFTVPVLVCCGVLFALLVFLVERRGRAVPKW